MDVTLASEEANSKLIEVVSVADVDAKSVWSVFCCRCLIEVMKLNLGLDSEASFSQDSDVWLRF